MKLGNFLSTYEDGPARPWHIKNKDKNRVRRAERNSVLWIERNIKWHVKHDQVKYQQLINNFIIKHKKNVFEIFGWKHWQLNLPEAHELQQIGNLLDWQMDIFQKYFRHVKGVILLPNAHARRDYRGIFHIRSAMVHSVPLQVPQTLVNRQQWRVQPINVYHVNEIEAIGQLANSIFEYGRFYIQAPLDKNEWIWGVGWDRSVAALAESGSLSITQHFHGKYGSVITTLTGPKAAENSFNYRQLTNQWYKRQLTNQLLKYPNVIIIAITKKKNGILVSKNVDICVMCFDEAAQKQWNDINKNNLKSIASPRIRRLNLKKEDIKAARKAHRDNRTITQTYWQERHNSLNLTPFIAVKIPSGLKPLKNSNNNRWSMDRIEEEAQNLLKKVQNTPFRFQSKADKAKLQSQLNNDNDMSMDHLDDNNANELNSNVSMNESQNANSNDQIMSQATGNSVSSDVNIHFHGSNANTNGTSVANERKSDSSFDINDELIGTSDGDHVIIVHEHNDNGNVNDDSNQNDNSNSNDGSKKHVLWGLESWKFNDGCVLTRMQEDEWKWRQTHVEAKTAQGDVLYKLDYESFALHEWNVDLPLKNNNETMEIMNTDCLFDQVNGIDYFYLENSSIPMLDESLEHMYRLFAITVQGLLFGLLQVDITDEIPSEQCRNGTYLGRKCVIQQRCSTANQIDLNCIEWDVQNGFECEPINEDVNTIDEIGSSNVIFDEQYGIHELHVLRVNLKTMMTFDNSAKNMVAGITKATGTYPCASCEAKGQDIYALPTPETMCFKSRNPSETARRAAQLNGGGHINGCKESPIYDLPVHRMAGSILHDMEGIFAVILSCAKGFINEYTGGSDAVVVLQQETSTDEIDARITEIDEKLDVLIPQYTADDESLKNKLNGSASDGMVSYLNILQKYSINEYYCMAGSVQGIMCARICKARHELVNLFKKISYVGGLLWELLMQNVNFLYTMLKHKHKCKFTNFELASLKNAYIDFYHQLIMVVRLWRSDGDLTIKPHYLMHDLEQTFVSCISNAYTDEERIENVNQLIKATLRLYMNCNGNRYGSKEMFIGRRMNNRVLSCG